MKTSVYTFVAWDERAMAAGADCAARSRQTALIPQREERGLGGDNVIDLNAWRAAEPEEFTAPAEDELDRGAGEPKESWPDLPAPRARRDHCRTLMAAELLSTLAVAVAALAIILRMLAF